MLIIFDQATPVPIRPYLKQHTVRTAAQQGWDTFSNGDLLTAAEEAGFDAEAREDSLAEPHFLLALAEGVRQAACQKGESVFQ